MGDLAVRQPHLGQEAIALLGRILKTGDSGLRQDDFVPYLLVRLLRCGYVRRKQAGSPLCVATQAGSERFQFECLLAKRRLEQLERREIIRGRIQAMADRLELDRVPVPAAPSLRELPLYRERQLPFLCEPPRPAKQARALPAPAAKNSTAPGARETPDDVLRAIREAEIRAKRERALPIPDIDAPQALESRDAKVVHIGRLPEPRSLVMPESSAASSPNEALSAVVIADVFDPRCDAERINDAGLVTDDAAGHSAPWSRTALAATVAAAILLIADPLHQHEAPSVQKAAAVSLAQMQAPAPPRGQSRPAIAAARVGSFKAPAPKLEGHAVAATISPHKKRLAPAMASPQPTTIARSTPPIVLADDAEATNQPHAGATGETTAAEVHAATHSGHMQVPALTRPVALPDPPPVVPGLPATAPSHMLTTYSVTSGHRNKSPSTIAIAAATANTPTAPPTPTVAPTPVLATVAPISSRPAVPPAPVHTDAPRPVALPSALVAPAETATVPVSQTELAEATPPSAPPSPPPNLVPAVAIATAPLVAEPSKPADKTPSDNPLTHRPDHASAAVHIHHKLVVADADVDRSTRILAQPDTHPYQHQDAHPDKQPDPHAVSPPDALKRVLARLRAGEESGDVMVDRLNTLSLEAARHGRSFIPPGVPRPSATAPRRPLAFALP